MKCTYLSLVEVPSRDTMSSISVHDKIVIRSTSLWKTFKKFVASSPCIFLLSSERSSEIPA